MNEPALCGWFGARAGIMSFIDGTIASRFCSTLRVDGDLTFQAQKLFCLT
jgi:hypothetical protein